MKQKICRSRSFGKTKSQAGAWKREEGGHGGPPHRDPLSKRRKSNLSTKYEILHSASLRSE
ncbi:MAG: hypothetical protein HY790_05955 [Deltaproteobacteria bacterium]|nr:hypothetical protein [Deltaproteobacteria bacterium]MBI4795370.1 hypothetical protein [Deltaproteobacteria bacterium]